MTSRGSIRGHGQKPWHLRYWPWAMVLLIGIALSAGETAEREEAARFGRSPEPSLGDALAGPLMLAGLGGCIFVFVKNRRNGSSNSDPDLDDVIERMNRGADAKALLDGLIELERRRGDRPILWSAVRPEVVVGMAKSHGLPALAALVQGVIRQDPGLRLEIASVPDGGDAEDFVEAVEEWQRQGWRLAAATDGGVVLLTGSADSEPPSTQRFGSIDAARDEILTKLQQTQPGAGIVELSCRQCGFGPVESVEIPGVIEAHMICPDCGTDLTR